MATIVVARVAKRTTTTNVTTAASVEERVVVKLFLPSLMRYTSALAYEDALGFRFSKSISNCPNSGFK